MPQTYGIVRECAARMQHLLPPADTLRRFYNLGVSANILSFTSLCRSRLMLLSMMCAAWAILVACQGDWQHAMQNHK